MKTTMHKAALLSCILLAAAAPIDNEKRTLSQYGDSSSEDPNSWSSFGGPGAASASANGGASATAYSGMFGEDLKFRTY